MSRLPYVLVSVILLAIGLSPERAQARPARVAMSVNMRTSPGVSYSIVDIIPGGAIVNARYCISNGWCRVEWRGRRGWINRKYLMVRRLRLRA
jgi:uncharacterized protein YraI